MFEDKHKNKMHSDDRILVLKPIEGRKAKNTAGLVDTRLFSGGNNLHAVRNPKTSLWYMKYQSGILPEPLRQGFTSIKALLEFAARYFTKRGIQIVEVVDNYA